MAKSKKKKTVYFCQSCGNEAAKWVGRCLHCGEWNSLVEEKIPVSGSHSNVSLESSISLDAVSLGTARLSSEEASEQRLSTGIGELDRVLGGGLVSDGFVLLGGDPGIGKSTLLLQMLQGIVTAQPSQEFKLLYVSGEESVQQIQSRAKRLGCTANDRILLSAQTQIESVMGLVKKHQPGVLIIDSLQTFSSEEVESAPGSVTQVREVSYQLMNLAKQKSIAVFLVGHVTKEGGIAGPKVIEHMVDTVLYFEGDTALHYRLLRTVKNRFGSTKELGVFEMEGEGLKEVKNPSSLFLSERSIDVSGTAIGSSLEGSRALLVELQALVAPSSLNFPRRTAVGLDASRVSLLAAILERHLNLKLAERDLFFNVAGGLRLAEPACDLAAAAAIWSSYEEIDLPRDWLFLGEVGLTGEVRNVTQPEIRIQEAQKLGFKVAVIPKAAKKRCEKIQGIKLACVETVGDLKKVFQTSALSMSSQPSASDRQVPLR